MKLILHIGTQKTGTTALQHFLHANRNPLVACGFHYATPPHGVQHGNAMAHALIAGKESIVQTFLTTHMDLAGRRGAHTILISAENFYAMSVQAALQRRQVCDNAVENDRALIERLPALIPKGITASRIVCYFRRPDRYAESIYSQHVKRGILFDGSFADFLPLVRPALFYSRYMRSWSDAFGKESCTIRIYEFAKADTVTDFVESVLHLDDTAQLTYEHDQVNERVSRDLLEFKRLKNNSAIFNERHIDRAILRLVDEEMQLRKTEPEHYQDFLSPYERAELLKLVEPEMVALQTSHDVPAFRPFDPESAIPNWSPYPGLDEHRRREIEFHYDRISGRVAFRLERFSLRAAAFLRMNVPLAGVLLDVSRGMGAKRALRWLVWRAQGANS